MAEMQTYQHTPLTSPRHIRLLKLLPSNDDQPIRCSIFNVALDATGRKRGTRYNALSYTWASIYPDTYIICDNQRIPITGNCELALRRFLKNRHGDPPLLPLWIDAICIWQSNIDERNAQVLIMGEIYKRACHVLIWIGTGFQGSDFLFKYVSVSRTGVIGWLRRQFGSRYSETFSMLAEEEPVFELMRLPWFSRVWTIQEAVLAQDPIIFCGNAAVPFDKLPLAASFDWEIGYKVKRITIFKCLRDFYKLNKGGSVKNTPDIAWIMDDISSRSVTEPKDKIFAIRDLLGDLGVALAPPDYGLSLGTIYWEATKVLLKEDIRILYLVNDSCLDLRAPSWVPDYRDGDLPQHFEFRLATGHFSANSPAARKADCFFYSLSDDGQSLKLNGIVLDSISQCSASKIWHPGKAFPIARTKYSTMTSHALDIIRPLQEFALVAYEMGASKGDQIWQCSFLSAVLGPYFESPKWRNAEEDWCEILLANRKEHNDGILPDSTQLPSTRVLDKYWSEMMSQKLWPWRDRTGTGFSWAASASEALANGASEEAVILFLLLSRHEHGFHAIMETMRGRRFFVTEQNFTGIGTISSRPGDIVMMVFGLEFPLIVRPTGKHNEYQLVGHAYVPAIHGQLERWIRGIECPFCEAKLQEDAGQKVAEIYLV